MTWVERLRGRIRDALGLHPTLDLHGFGASDARELTERFLRDARAEGVATVRIVYGKGRHSPGGHGVLRHVIPRWLDNEGFELVERYQRRLDQSGDDGYVIVWLRRSDGPADGTGAGRETER